MKATYLRKDYHHRDFSSHSFTKLFISHNFPIGVQANNLQLSEAYWKLGTTIQSIIQHVNDNEVWTIIGWYSKGLIDERTLTEIVGNRLNNLSVSNSGSNQKNA